MNGLDITYDWLDVPGAERSELKHTFAQLTIRIGTRYATRVFDRRAQTTRNHIVVPLYPLAEWIAAHWWLLLEEAEVPGPGRGIRLGAYNARHSLRHGREGYSLPDLKMCPEGDTIRLIWSPFRPEHENVEFLGDGEARVSLDAVRDAFSDFIEGVLKRLEIRGEPENWLRDEWRRIQESTADQDELAFCRAAAWLGQDPYELDDSAAAAICGAWDDLPESVRGDAFRAIGLDTLNDAATWIKNGVEQIASARSGDLEIDWGGISHVRDTLSAMPPWEQGYRLASELQVIVNPSNSIPVPLLTNDGPAFIRADGPPVASLEGLFAATRAGALCYTAKVPSASRRFVFARGLGESLFRRTAFPVLLTSSRTFEQQRSRAFAAELLAPASLI